MAKVLQVLLMLLRQFLQVLLVSMIKPVELSLEMIVEPASGELLHEPSRGRYRHASYP